MKKFIILLSVAMGSTQLYAQNWAKIYYGGKVEDGKWVTSFDLDLNRTESKSAGTNSGVYPIGGGNSPFYFKPSASISVGGDSAKVASDDVLVQAEFLYLLRGLRYISPIIEKGNRNIKKKRFWKVQLNPSYNADKHFNERLFYVQPQFIKYDFIHENYPKGVMSGNIFVTHFESSAFSNIGGRNSRDFQTSEFYATAGVNGVFSWELRKSKNAERKGVMTVKLEGTVMQILNEAKHFQSIAPTRYTFKAGVDFYIAKNLTLGIEYKSGDIAPDYARYESYGLTMKFKK